MARSKRAFQQAQLKLHFQGILTSAFCASTIGFAYMGIIYGWTWDDSFQALMTGFLIGAACHCFEVFVFDSYLRRFPSFIGFICRSLAYQTIVLGSFSLNLSIFNGLSLLDAYAMILFRDKFFAGCMATGFNFMILVNRMLGHKALWVFFSGRYNKPRLEHRELLYLEFPYPEGIQLKDRKDYPLHRFQQEILFDLSGPILNHRGEIYRYYPNGIMVSWSNGKEDNSLDCVREMMEKIDEKSEEYLQSFRFQPRIYAYSISGEITVGEIGDHKKEIAFLGQPIYWLETARRSIPVVEDSLTSSFNYEGSDPLSEVPESLPKMHRIKI